MAIQTINIGNLVNDGLGDDLRTAFQKVNANFAELGTVSTTTASNLGTTGAGIFKSKVGADLQFKRLISGNNISLVEGSETITVANTATPAFTQITTDAGTVGATTFPALTVKGGSNGDIDVTVIGSEISINTAMPFGNMLTSFDFGPAEPGRYTNAIQLLFSLTPIDFGTITSPTNLQLDCGGII
jgi:hypothetical protein